MVSVRNPKLNSVNIEEKSNQMLSVLQKRLGYQKPEPFSKIKKAYETNKRKYEILEAEADARK